MLMFTKFSNRINASCKFITNDLILDNKVTVTHTHIYIYIRGYFCQSLALVLQICFLQESA